MRWMKDFRPRRLNGIQWFWFLAFMGLLTRLPLLRLASAETTDGILCLTYFSPHRVPTPRFVILPFYPAFLFIGQSLGMAGWFWGRLLSAAAGILFLIPLWKFARRWLPEEMAGMVCLMALFSPLLWQWSLKVMPDTLFLLFFWWGLERLTAVEVERSIPAWWQAALLGAAAAATRPEGFLLLPWILVSGIGLSGRGLGGRTAGLLAAWAAPAWFMGQKFITLLFAYREGLGLTEGAEQVRFPFLNFVEHLYAYLSQPFYVFTPLVFLFAVPGLVKMAWRGGAEGAAFRKITLQIYVLLLLSRLIPTTYQDRHMLPFLPLLLTAAGYQLESFFSGLDGSAGEVKRMFLRNGLLTLCLLWLSLFSAAVLISQCDSFGDIKRSSEFLKTLPPNAVVYSDEVPKTRYWSGRPVRLLPYLAANRPFVPDPGDYVVLHSFYTPRIAFVDRTLVDKHDAEVLADDPSMVVPLLTDVMEDPALQNRIAATAFRFQPQFFRSRVYLIRK